MSDYTKTTNFTAKDALSTGDSNKLIKGSLFDTEFDNLATAVATKYDSGDLASQAQAQAGTLNTVLMTPLRAEEHTQTFVDENGGILGETHLLADPGADGLLGWDDGESAGANVIFFTAGTALAFSGTTIELSHLGLEDLADPDADRIAFWDDSAGKFDWLVPNDGLSITTTNLNLDDVAAGVAQPVVISSGAFTFDLSSITEIVASALSQSADGYLINDAGTLKVMPHDQSGLPVLTADAAQTFAITDANTINVLTGSTNRIWTIPANSSVAFEIGSFIILGNSGTGDLTITADTGVIIDSIFHAAGATAQSDRVLDGGSAVLIKTATDTWQLSGDIANS